MKSSDAVGARDASSSLLPVGARGVLIALLAAFVFGLVIKAAFAVEYHTVSGLPHGWVGGESASDGSFFARADGRGTGLGSVCYIDSADHPFPSSPTRGYTLEFAALCNAWSNDFFTDSPTECHWRAYVGNGSPVAVHHHVADNYCG